MNGGASTLNTCHGRRARRRAVGAGGHEQLHDHARPILSNTGTTGSGVFNNAATMSAVNNWWGLQFGPGVAFLGMRRARGRQRLESVWTRDEPDDCQFPRAWNASASPAADPASGQTSTLTADLTLNSAPSDTRGAGGTIMDRDGASFGPRRLTKMFARTASSTLTSQRQDRRI